jgi:deazaflavin-dependent oxidoreductase (nitroreductase family)
VAHDPFVQVPKPFLRALAFVHRNLLRISRGKLGGTFHGEPMILLTTTGRTSGKSRTLPLSALAEGDGWVVAASNSGHDVHPGWYVNLRANPDAIVTLDGQKVGVQARDASDAERATYWPRFVAYFAAYAKYTRATDRKIPIIVLERVGDAPSSTG